MVVLINSIGMTYELWQPQMAALEPGFRVLRYDQRGHGEAPVPPGPYSVGDLGSDLLGLLGELGLERASLCGLSIGGMVAMWVAAHAPERVEHLVLACTSACPGNPEKWADRAVRARSGGLCGIAEQSSHGWFTPKFIEHHPDVVSRFRSIAEHNPSEGYACCCAVLESLDLRPDLGAIIAPTLVIAGAEDRSFPPSHSYEIESGIVGSSVEILAGAAHFANVERPAEFNQLLLGALSSSRGRGAIS